MYTGYNDLRENNYIFRQRSSVFRLTGYMPIFLFIFEEKALALRYNGDLEAAKRGKKTNFTPDLADKTSIVVLEAANKVADALEKQLGRISGELKEGINVFDKSGNKRWENYRRRIKTAINYALYKGKKVIIVTQPYRMHMFCSRKHCAHY